MTRKSQADLIHEMTDRQVTVQLIISQLIFILLAVFGSLILFDSFWSDWGRLFQFSLHQWFWYGCIPGLIVLLIDIILVYSLPKKYYDDGGINEKVFRNRSIGSIFGITLLIAVCEEVLFRGVLHTEFGYFAASLLFAIMHIRYLKKIVLLVSVLFVSFFIGYVYEITGNLMVTITSHFIIDFFLALWIRFGKWGGADGRRITATNPSRGLE
ncbi:CPBP family intramembrane glutamic endopeptidase [Halobacillus yeomjeoni]|uniref:CPBP family intramembrane metalloprotease n=1 Tax=Halobacillus yeomjeoni TaxID=311194 RepID=A0A931MUS5_9BACI|nr:CPBP family intramembrane glutamic endopeptidase [Halobacillus yeomjeoni]MBH0229619.1 CPBP family intramembrane metalloprotease [Halobacillus yeomjeoni]